MSNKVVIIGRNYTSRLGMIRAVGMGGYDVIVIKTNGVQEIKDIDAYSKYVKKYLYAKEPNRKELINVILSLKSDTEKIILIPVDDYAASTIDEHIDILKSDFLFPNVNMKQGAINHLMDKNIQKELAIKAGLNVAKGWVVDIMNHTYSLPSNIIYPVFPKPQISFKGNKRCMKKCSNEIELREVLDEVARQRDCPMLLEQYIEIDREFGVLGVCCNDWIKTPGIVKKELIGEGCHKGVTKVGVVTPLHENKVLHKSIQSFLELTNFTGLCDIDLYEHNGTIYFNELNLRFGAFGYSIICAGENLPLQFIRCLLGESMDNFNHEKISPRTVCISEKVNFDDYNNYFYGMKEYKRIESMADYSFLRDEKDIKPYKIFLSQSFSLKYRIIRLIRHIKNLYEKYKNGYR